MTIPAPEEYRGPRTFTSAVAICLQRYFQISGRAPRSEYWYFVLFTVLVSIATSMLDIAAFGREVTVFGLINLFFVIPSITVLVRRLHDIDRSGWWWFIILIPLIGFVILLIWACIRGTPGPNRFGPDPLGGNGGPDPQRWTTG